MAEIFNREVWVTEVTPEMMLDWHHFALTVRWRGQGDEWVVCHHAFKYMDANGHMSFKNFENEAWEKAHIFTYDQAVAIATKHAGSVIVNGHLARNVAASHG